MVDKGDEYTPSAYTLNTIAKYIGFSDILEYCSGSDTIQSKEYSGEYIETDSLPADAEITILWRGCLASLGSLFFRSVRLKNKAFMLKFSAKAFAMS
ncbi:MAG: hypothetical protein HDS70_05000 [Bacteroidales bacterium]|nr:hypothetical protein [Bacteroidales bacterium]